MHLRKSHEFLAFIDPLISAELENKKSSELEKLCVKAAIYSIFESNFDLGKIHFELIEYLEKKKFSPSLITQIENFYNSLSICQQKP